MLVYFLIVLSSGAVQAQGNLGEGSPGDQEIFLDLRFFPGREEFYALGWQRNWSPEVQGRLTLLKFQSRTRGELIADSRWHSYLALGEVAGRFRTSYGHGMETWLEVGVELPNSRGRNLTIQERADSHHPIFTLAYSLQRSRPRAGKPPRIVWRVAPRLAFGESSVRSSPGETLSNFGTVGGLELGVQTSIDPSWDVQGTVIPLWTGDNTIDPQTGRLDRAVVWSLGAGYRPYRKGDPPGHPSSPWHVEAFLTNAAGPTGATSLLAAVDGSVAPGLRLSYGL
jgi:hypothetical protein